MKEIIDKFIMNFSVFGFAIVLYFFAWIVNDIIPSLTRKVELASDVFYIEYGSPIPRLADSYTIERDKHISTDAVFTLVREDEKQYKDEVGKYHAYITYKGKEHHFDIIVQDTTAPRIKHIREEYFVEQYSTGLEYDRFFYIEDKSEFTIEVDASSIDINTPGSYNVIVKAKDIYGNESEENVKFTVLSTAESSVLTLTPYSGGIMPKRPNK